MSDDPGPRAKDGVNPGGDPFADALNAFGSDPDKEKLRLALDTHGQDLGAVLAAITGLELPTHYAKYFGHPDLRLFVPLFLGVLEWVADGDRTYSLDIQMGLPDLATTIDGTNATVLVRARPDLDTPGPSA